MTIATASTAQLTKEPFLRKLDFRMHDIAVDATERYGNWIDNAVLGPPLVHGTDSDGECTTSQPYLVIVSDEDDNLTDELRLTSAAFHSHHGWLESITLQELEGVVAWLQPSGEAVKASSPPLSANELEEKNWERDWALIQDCSKRLRQLTSVAKTSKPEVTQSETAIPAS